MDRPGPRGSETHADLAGEFGMGASHEGGHFFMPDANVVEAIRRAPHGAHQPVNAIARITKDAFDAPVGESLKNEIPYFLGHAVLRRSAQRFATIRDEAPVQAEPCNLGSWR
jgi:hypothetical protein